MFLKSHMMKYIDVINDFEAEVQKASDISIVIMGANIIDSMLKDILLLVTTEKSYVFEDTFNLKEYKYDSKRFFDRINKLDKLNLLSKQNANLLHKLRKIRNVFGHELLVSNLEDLEIVNKEVYKILFKLRLPKNSYFVELEPTNDEEYYLLDMNPIKTDTSLQHRFIFLFNYLFHNLRWTIEYLVLENEKNTSYSEQLSKELHFKFKDYICTESGSFNYKKLYHLRTYVVDRYIDEHIEKIQRDKEELYSIIEEKLKKYPGNKVIEIQALQLRSKGEKSYEHGVNKFEEIRKQLQITLSKYTYYYKSYKLSEENCL